MACSVCRIKGHTKKNCPKLEEDRKEKIRLVRDRINIIISSPAFNTIATAGVYAALSQTLQKRGYWENIAGESLDMGILLSGAAGQQEPALILGAMGSQLVDEGGFVSPWLTFFEDAINFLTFESIGREKVPIIDPETGETVWISDNPYPEDTALWRKFECKENPKYTTVPCHLLDTYGNIRPE